MKHPEFLLIALLLAFGITALIDFYVDWFFGNPENRKNPHS